MARCSPVLLRAFFNVNEGHAKSTEKWLVISSLSRLLLRIP